MNSPKHRIKEIREDKKLSGIEIAQALNISPQYYYDIEKGKRNLSADIATQLAKIFNVSVDYLLGIDKFDNLTSKEEKDIAKDLEKMLANLESDNGLAFMGEPMDDETKELMKISLENSMRLAKQLAKKKYTPKKYK
ncbi:MAG TPA: helix-turn-helix transcriptional regulator [Desulfitobacterium dehalogenans]|uniref:Helix-turn-helix transcriptional regulator n=1 Tax=Desulfitobacterium dehalogenans TaxID=36854 RepID=A0A7C7DA44_9FIRM|nr:helix-turn-helix transcriptional regulator [Desulfitobacterium dehalogenans]